MGNAIGETLPLALGVAISPVPIIAAILMLLSPKAKSTSVGFLVGWLVGILVAVVVFTLLSSILPAADPDATKPIAGIIKIVLGVLLLFVAFRQWRSRPREGQEAKLPGWMSAIDTMTPVRALGLAFLLAAVNPKNLLLAASAGIAIGAASVSAGGVVITIVIFTVIAGCSVGIPVIAFLIAGDRLRTPLNSLHVWLVQYNAVVMTVVLLLLGVVVIGKGITSF